MRRSLELLAAVVMGIVASPLIALSALVLLVADGRPLLFCQQRVGLDGREFRIVKFRTMRPATGPEDEDDDLGRSTRLGGWLRSTSIDELPQLWNILRGDMGFIGPRPTLPEQVVHYDEHQRRRHEVRPGLTGWAQVNGRNTLGWPERIELDVWYVDHRSVRLDMRILARTVTCLVRRNGVTGVGGINPDFPAPPARATSTEPSARPPVAAPPAVPAPRRNTPSAAPARRGAPS
jgi:lipopolysaccharide/colanic/teichoic acid biosynthesis glycosyltransferase